MESNQSLTNQSRQSGTLSTPADNRRVFHCKPTDIGKQLGYVFALLGLTKAEMPTGDIQKALINFIATRYANLLVDDIQNAFEGAITNKFLIDEDKKINDMGLYGKVFSGAYFARTVNAYLEFKRSIPVVKSKALVESKSEEQTKQERRASQDRMLIAHEEHMAKHKALPAIIDIFGIYPALQRQNKIDLSPEHIEEIRERAKRELGKDYSMLVLNEQVNKIMDTKKQDQKEMIRDEMKRQYVKEYLTSLIEVK